MHSTQENASVHRGRVQTDMVQIDRAQAGRDETRFNPLNGLKKKLFQNLYRRFFDSTVRFQSSESGCRQEIVRRIRI